MSGESAGGPGASQPTVAGLYDYYLGGTNFTTADKAVGEQILEAVPLIPAAARSNRAFLGRAVHWMAAERGIRQFIDLGAGYPASGAVHDIGQAVDPHVRVAYADNDPVVVARGREILAGVPGTTMIEADLLEPDAVLGSIRASGLIDFDQPAGLLMLAVTHFIPDADDPFGLVRRYLAALAPGSYLALTAGTVDGHPEQPIEEGKQAYAESANPVTLRTKAEFERFFDGLEIVPPYPGAGREVTFVGLWGRDDLEAPDVDRSGWGYAAVARKTS
jgi:S-adenosyl methyltransferase